MWRDVSGFDSFPSFLARVVEFELAWPLRLVDDDEDDVEDLLAFLELLEEMDLMLRFFQPPPPFPLLVASFFPFFCC